MDKIINLIFEAVILLIEENMEKTSKVIHEFVESKK